MQVYKAMSIPCIYVPPGKIYFKVVSKWLLNDFGGLWVKISVRSSCCLNECFLFQEFFRPPLPDRPNRNFTCVPEPCRARTVHALHGSGTRATFRMHKATVCHDSFTATSAGVRFWINGWEKLLCLQSLIILNFGVNRKQVMFFCWKSVAVVKMHWIVLSPWYV